MKVLNKRAGEGPPGAVYVGRPSKWGNPFVVGRDGTREEVIELYREHLQHVLTYRPRFLEALRGKDLVCWCAPAPCHADVLIDWANR